MRKIVIEKPKENIEKQENDRLDLSFFKKKSSAKSYKGWLIGEFKKAINDKNRDVAYILQTCYKKYMEFEKVTGKPLIEVEIVEGWKGIDKLELFKGFTNNFVIKSHTKDKEGIVTTQTHQIPFERVNVLLFLIKGWKVGENHKCYDFALKLGYSDWKELWKERKEYFELYYYPIKILEALGVVKYSGRGLVTRIK